MTRRGGTWGVAFLAMFACSWGGNHFSPLLLLYRQDEHWSSALVNLLLGFYVVGLVPALLIAGAVSARVGRKPVIVAGLVSAILGSVLLWVGPQLLPLMFLGRLLAGIPVGVAMSVGTGWIKELSVPPYDPVADPTSGARRGSLAFTMGAAIGAVLSGVIAQFSPWGEWAPYVLHLVIALVALAAVLAPRTPETLDAADRASTIRASIAVPAARHPRFTKVVIVAAPWIFIGAGIAYGWFPTLMEQRSGALGIGYASLLGALTLGTAACVQPFAKRLHSVGSARGLVTALTVLTVGLALVAVAGLVGSLLLGAVAGVVVGVGVGVGLVCGMLEVERVAGPGGLAGLSGAFYAVAYVGFLVPSAVAALVPVFGLAEVLLPLVGLAVLSTVVLSFRSRRHLETPWTRR